MQCRPISSSGARGTLEWPQDVWHHHKRSRHCARRHAKHHFLRKSEAVNTPSLHDKKVSKLEDASAHASTKMRKKKTNTIEIRKACKGSSSSALVCKDAHAVDMC